MTDIYSFSRRNNEAIALLLAGNNQQAMAILSNTIDSLKRVLLSQRSSIEKAPFSCDCHEFFRLNCFDGPKNSYVFNRAISLSMDKLHVLANADMETATQLLSGAVLFNMALAHHRDGLITKKILLQSSHYNIQPGAEGAQQEKKLSWHSWCSQTGCYE